MDFGQAAVNGVNGVNGQQKDDKSTPNSSYVIISSSSPDNHHHHTGSTTEDDNNNDRFIHIGVNTGSTTEPTEESKVKEEEEKEEEEPQLSVKAQINAVQINAKYNEYDQLDGQLEKLQQQAMQTQRSMADDDKQLKRQIKQSVKNRIDDDTDTDEYKDLSSTTNSDPTLATNMTTTEPIISYENKKLPWYKNVNIIAGIVGIGVIVGVILYNNYNKVYFQKSNNNQTFRWLKIPQNDDRNINRYRKRLF